ncbi:hypothetical protein VB712_01315 [Spirulina sp. CCNP1310]|uniref:hypothetical protein n=1 Tax=Spirulina sp. CCNP1310 TaxID=3110249 RepID=UPI002B1FEA38|nr:hypothetical protein [Spirulina sp. CCNP1310]MEA5417842.1 hypothetical protein [Spirulina sp. CCNP1310]
MAIIPLKAWYLDGYEPLSEVIQRPQDLRLNRNSLLKSGLRADFLDDGAMVQGAAWFEAYLEGAEVLFYIEGSGGYAIANLDLLSQEIYFTKQDINARFDPVVLVSTAEPEGELVGALGEILEELNRRSRLPLTLKLAPRPVGVISPAHLRQIRKSLVWIADLTPEGRVDPLVSLELGYAIAQKRPGQILTVQTTDGPLPYHLPNPQTLIIPPGAATAALLTPWLETTLARFNLLSISRSERELAH